MNCRFLLQQLSPGMECKERESLKQLCIVRSSTKVLACLRLRFGFGSIMKYLLELCYMQSWINWTNEPLQDELSILPSAIICAAKVCHIDARSITSGS